MRRLAKPVTPYRGSEGSNPSLSATVEEGCMREIVPKRAGAGRIATAVALVAATCACAAKKTLTVTSNPSGAVIRIDESIVGTTPYTLRFDAYGTRRVTLYRDGYRTATRTVPLVPPWYGRFPLDIVSEVLLPVGWHDDHRVDFDLEPHTGMVTEPDLDAVL